MALEMITIGGTAHAIVTEAKMVCTDSDGFRFATMFVTAKAVWDGAEVYARITPHTREIVERFATVEAMRDGYRAKLAEGWTRAA